MNMLSQIAKLLGIREDQVDGTLKSDQDARRFLSRRGLLLGAVGAAAGVVVPAAPMVQVAERIVTVYDLTAAYAFDSPLSELYREHIMGRLFKHADGSRITVRELTEVNPP